MIHACRLLAVLLFLAIPSGAWAASRVMITQSTDVGVNTGFKDLLVTCPAGMVISGGGARVFGSITDTALTTSGPEGTRAWYAVAIGPPIGDWGLRVDAFCVRAGTEQ